VGTERTGWGKPALTIPIEALAQTSLCVEKYSKNDIYIYIKAPQPTPSLIQSCPILMSSFLLTVAAGRKSSLWWATVCQALV